MKTARVIVDVLGALVLVMGGRQVWESMTVELNGGATCHSVSGPD